MILRAHDVSAETRPEQEDVRCRFDRVKAGHRRQGQAAGLLDEAASELQNYASGPSSQAENF